MVNSTVPGTVTFTCPSPSSSSVNPHVFFHLESSTVCLHAQVWERPMALQAELTLTMNVLGNVTDLAPGDILDQPLHTLHHIHSQLQSCVSSGIPSHTKGWL